MKCVRGSGRVTSNRGVRLSRQQPGVLRIVGHRLEQPVLVIPLERDHSRFRFVAQMEDPIDDLRTVSAPIDVVAEEHDRVLRCQGWLKLREQVVERSYIAVYVAYCDGRHFVKRRITGTRCVYRIALTPMPP